MKKAIILAIFSLIIYATPASACCFEGGGDRLLTGLKNFASAPLEIPKKTAYYSHDTGYHPFGIAAGVGEGGIAATQKFLAGIIQILTFPFDASDISYDLYR